MFQKHISRFGVMMRPTTAIENKRASEPMHIRKKFLIISEGYVTERKYFEAVSEIQKEYSQTPMVDIVVLGRYALQDGYSDPIKLISLTDEYIHMLKTGEYSENLLIGKIIESLIKFGHKFEKHKENIAK